MIQRIFSRIKSNKYLRIIIGIIIGSALGFAYYKFIGCNSGTCAITSNPYISTAYGALFGGILIR